MIERDCLLAGREAFEGERLERSGGQTGNIGRRSAVRLGRDKRVVEVKVGSDQRCLQCLARVVGNRVLRDGCDEEMSKKSKAPSKWFESSDGLDSGVNSSEMTDTSETIRGRVPCYTPTGPSERRTVTASCATRPSGVLSI